MKIRRAVWKTVVVVNPDSRRGISMAVNPSSQAYCIQFAVPGTLTGNMLWAQRMFQVVA